MRIVTNKASMSVDSVYTMQCHLSIELGFSNFVNCFDYFTRLNITKRVPVKYTWRADGLHRSRPLETYRIGSHSNTNKSSNEMKNISLKWKHCNQYEGEYSGTIDWDALVKETIKYVLLLQDNHFPLYKNVRVHTGNISAFRNTGHSRTFILRCRLIHIVYTNALWNKSR